MQIKSFRAGQYVLSMFVFCWLALVPLAHANDSGGAAPGGEPVKLTVNLQSTTGEGRYLQFEIVFEGTPEASLAITANRPRVLHKLILLLSDERSEHLITLKGKHDLADKIVEEVNRVIDETEKTGVHEVLFTNFIIQ